MMRSSVPTQSMWKNQPAETMAATQNLVHSKRRRKTKFCGAQIAFFIRFLSENQSRRFLVLRSRNGAWIYCLVQLCDLRFEKKLLSVN